MVIGGGPDQDLGGFFIKPTVLTRDPFTLD